MNTKLYTNLDRLAWICEELARTHPLYEGAPVKARKSIYRLARGCLQDLAAIESASEDNEAWLEGGCVRVIVDGTGWMTVHLDPMRPDVLEWGYVDVDEDGELAQPDEGEEPPKP